ncbi:NAD(P)-dependent oxidoreductase [Streptococcus equi subsp. equi]|uniref:NAD(P)-dependent oxidoreductase n=1 Tax=Streptococcus equi TaxID=1336 RepID=UPI00294ADAB3|nr:NAD(P)-dependent oxidoreductase [Streptococcus equi]WOK44936.1 NAD(P)-dependent oxidoreductase [Streptococcus equi subsp. equi]WOK46808.1 NAD(P)-dependent oxidoreductase [Streptococcus equi subsp. equi]WOK48711.1 NAD(P)-dependent oxidoreductase [Streptococcus equi subsp. equi]
MFDTLIKFSKDREKLDFYATDKRAIHELLKREQFLSPIYEPACGMGHIGKVLEEYGYKVKATDICYRGYGEEREVDFFTVTENILDIVTNPPYFCASEFLRYALEISGPKVKIAMLFRLAFLEGQSRYELFRKYPPKRVYVFSKRLNCAKNGEFEKYKSSAIAFAWFIWEVGYKGITELRWIR